VGSPRKKLRRLKTVANEGFEGVFQDVKEKGWETVADGGGGLEWGGVHGGIGREIGGGIPLGNWKRVLGVQVEFFVLKENKKGERLQKKEEQEGV